MPTYDDDEFDFGSLPEIQQQEYLYELIGFTASPQDYEAHNMFWDVMYNDELTLDQRAGMYESLSSYLYDNYGMDFADLWDWEDFRAWYDSQ